MHKFARLDKTQANKSDLIEALVNRVIIYPEKIAILINVTDKANTPPSGTDNCSLGDVFVLL